MIKRICREEIHFNLGSEDILESYIYIFKNRGATVTVDEKEDRFVLNYELEINIEE